MKKGDLEPESILSGYSVLVKSLETRRDELRDQLTTANKEIERLRGDNHSGCVHTINTAVDREGCCVSCGEDLNYIAIQQLEIERLRRVIDEGKKLLARSLARITFLEKRSHISTSESEAIKQFLKGE